jgi:lipopolysaccharide/colanic/teichoic acid biosynthesis glycosyltransferase
MRGVSPPAAAPMGARSSLDENVKRLLDIVVATALLVVLLPLLVAVAAAVKLDSRGPVFFRCRRVGHRGEILEMLKFRKMRRDACGAALTVRDDRRFTRVGRFLAKSKLDELPQLWNVVKGEMSLVGPRPEDPAFVEACSEDYATILQVRPGVTGLCQLAFAKESDILDPQKRHEDYLTRLLPQKAALDRFYAESRSLQMDTRILAWTIRAVFLRQNVAVNRSNGQLTWRRRQSMPLAAVESNP